MTAAQPLCSAMLMKPRRRSGRPRHAKQLSGSWGSNMFEAPAALTCTARLSGVTVMMPSLRQVQCGATLDMAFGFRVLLHETAAAAEVWSALFLVQGLLYNRGLKARHPANGSETLFQ